MSYRTYINGHEWLGNNEGPQVILDELKRQGCPFNEDWCTWDNEKCDVASFEVKDLQALIDVVEEAILEMYKNNPNIANFKDAVQNNKHNLTSRMVELKDNAYIFWSASLLSYTGKENYTIAYDVKKNRIIYKLKPGAKCIFKAY